MQQKRELINLTIINNSNSVIAIPLFQNNVASINATTKYAYDITGIDLSCGTASLVINSVSYSVTFDTTLQGLVNALSALGFGLFGIEGTTFLYTTDDTNVYGSLDLCGGGGTTTTTTTSTTTAAPTTSTTTTTTTVAPATSTTTTTTTAAPTTTSTTTSTTTEAPTTSTTTTTTTEAPTTTSTTTSTTTEAPTTTSTTTSTTTEAPTTTSTTTTTTTDTPPPTTSTTTTTTTAAPLLRTFRINNTDLSNNITLDVQINSVQVISPTLIPFNSVITLTPQVDCAGYTNVTLEYQLVSGYTPTSASFSNGSGTYTGSIAGGFITFTGVDLTPNTTQDLTVNP